MKYYLIGEGGELLQTKEVSEAPRYHWVPEAELEKWFGSEAEAKADLVTATQEGRATGARNIHQISELELMWDNGGPEDYLGHPASGERWIDEKEFGERYDEAKATEILRRSTDLPAGDFRDCTETLYQTADGKYFLVGSGGAMTRWAEETENGGYGFGSGVLPLSESEALSLIEAAESE